MKNYLLLLLLIYVALPCKSKIPDPPTVKIGPFDEEYSAKGMTSPSGTDDKKFEGDIQFSGRESSGKIGEAGTRTPWPDAVIPYVFDCSVLSLKSAVDATFAAMKEWESRTCIKFVEKKPHHKVYLEFIRAAGCWATYVGYKGKKTQVSIGNGCDFKHVMVHELGHVIGFWHEQSRPDRDSYIRINRGNVIRSLLYNFDIVKEQVNNYGEAYDYASIMHYPWNAFAIDRRRSTIEPIRSLGNKRPYVKLSESDVRQTERMYNCPAVRLERKKAIKAIGEAKNKIGGASLAGPKCQDAHKLCPLWSKHGHCKLAPDPMLTFCAKSCDNCGECEDDYPDCKAWADYGLCVSDDNVVLVFMLSQCKLSCSVCRAAPTKKPTQKPTTQKATTKKPTEKTTTTKKPTKAPTKAPTKPPTNKVRPKPDTKKPITKGGISTPTKKFTGVKCKDRSKYCKDWSRAGRCNTDRWVYDNCMLSCKRFDVCDQEVIKPIGSCTKPLGVHDVNKIANNKFHGTSTFSPGGGWYAPPYAARLYKEDDHRLKQVGAWCASPRTKDSYLRIDLGRRRRITALATQGRDVYFEHVKAYTLSFSNDRSNWREYQENRVKKVFDGNCDHVTPVLNLIEPQYARFVRIHPVKYIGAACLRVEIYGC